MRLTKPLPFENDLWRGGESSGVLRKSVPAIESTMGNLRIILSIRCVSRDTFHSYADLFEKQVLGRVVVDTLSYFNRYAFEALQRSTNDDCPDVKTDSYNGDQGSCLVGCQCPSCAGHSDIIRRSRFGGYNGLDPEEDSPPEDDTFFFLCSCRIFGFVLRSRTWRKCFL